MDELVHHGADWSGFTKLSDALLDEVENHKGTRDYVEVLVDLMEATIDLPPECSGPFNAPWVKQMISSTISEGGFPNFASLWLALVKCPPSKPLVAAIVEQACEVLLPYDSRISGAEATEPSLISINLRPRVAEGLELLRRGKTVQQAAHQMGITTTTLYNYLAVARQAFGVTTTCEAVVRFAEISKAKSR